MSAAHRHVNALTAVYETALPISIHSHRSFAASNCVMDLASAASGPLHELRIHLIKTVDMAETSWLSLVKCELFQALNCILTTGDDDEYHSKVKAALCALRSLVTLRKGWTVHARKAGVHITLCEILARTDLNRGEVDNVCGHLGSLLQYQNYSVLYNMHKLGVTRSILFHLSPRACPLFLLAQLLNCNSACRTVLRHTERIHSVISVLFECIGGQCGVDEKRYVSAVDCFTKLLDNDLPRVSAQLNKELWTRTLREQLLVGGKEKPQALRIVRSLLGKGLTCFSGQGKERKLPSSYEIEQHVCQWAEALGGECVKTVGHILGRTHLLPEIRSCLLILTQLCQHVTVPPAYAHVVAGALSSHLIGCHDLMRVRCTLQVLIQVSLASNMCCRALSPLAVSYCKSSLEKRDFQIICRETRLYVCKPVIELQDNDCVVCLEKLEGGESRMTSCGHYFHRQCLAKWFYKGRKGTCPLCRSVGVDAVAQLIHD